MERRAAMRYYANMPDDRKQMVASYFRAKEASGGVVGMVTMQRFLDLQRRLPTNLVCDGYGCRSSLWGQHFLCVECYNASNQPYDLCGSCFGTRNFSHVHSSSFMDNHDLLRLRPWENNTREQQQNTLGRQDNTWVLQHNTWGQQQQQQISAWEQQQQQQINAWEQLQQINPWGQQNNTLQQQINACEQQQINPWGQQNNTWVPQDNTGVPQNNTSGLAQDVLNAFMASPAATDDGCTTM